MAVLFADAAVLNKSEARDDMVTRAAAVAGAVAVAVAAAVAAAAVAAVAAPAPRVGGVEEIGDFEKYPPISYSTP